MRLRHAIFLSGAVSTVAATGCVQSPPPPTALPQATATHWVNPLVGAKFFVDPGSQAADEARKIGGAPGRLLMRIASQPQADWMGEWTPGIESAVRDRVQQARNAGAARVFVAYNIPNRDCGQYSKGGLDDPDKYRKWILGFARGIGDAGAVVILEPDALGQLRSCLDENHAQERLGLLRYAIRALRQQPHTAVYLDAGNANWVAADEMAQRLVAAGVEEAHGFSLNVSNYVDTPKTIAYGKEIARHIGEPVPFIVDTSRNGQGEAPDLAWCNPTGRGLGRAPTTATGDPQVHAFLWIKRPGESDGTCNGGPPAGQWYLDQALELVVKGKL